VTGVVQREPAAPDTVRVVADLPHRPEPVWRTLTGPALLACWLMPGDAAPRVGHRFTLTAPPALGWWGTVACHWSATLRPASTAPDRQNPASTEPGRVQVWSASATTTP